MYCTYGLSLLLVFGRFVSSDWWKLSRPYFARVLKAASFGRYSQSWDGWSVTLSHHSHSIELVLNALLFTVAMLGGVDSQKCMPPLASCMYATNTVQEEGSSVLSQHFSNRRIHFWMHWCVFMSWFDVFCQHLLKVLVALVVYKCEC